MSGETEVDVGCVKGWIIRPLLMLLSHHDATRRYPNLLPIVMTFGEIEIECTLSNNIISTMEISVLFEWLCIFVCYAQEVDLVALPPHHMGG
jgi:hypothetical protein